MKQAYGSLIAGLAVAVAVVVVLFWPSDPPPGVDSAVGAKSRVGWAENLPDQPPRKLPRPAADAPRSRLAGLPAPVESPYLAGSAENEDWIEARTAELDDLAWFEDAESLGKIQAELLNPLPEIRAAALAAIVSFGSRDSIPILEAVAGRTRDSLEQKALGDAIEHLKLPTVIEELERPAAD